MPRRARSSQATCWTPAATSAGCSASSAATDSNPQLWGLHNYGDVTYGTTEGTDAVLRTVQGQLWIEETGGIVVLRNAAGRTTLSFNETRAAAEHRPGVRDRRGAAADHADVHLPLAGRADEPLRRRARSPRRQPAPELRGGAARHRRPARGVGHGDAGEQHAEVDGDMVEGQARLPAAARDLHDERREVRRQGRPEAAHAHAPRAARSSSPRSARRAATARPRRSARRPCTSA